MASAGYVVLTRGAGTPFRDTLAPEQREVLRKSTAVRRRAFERSLLAAVAVLLVWRPLRPSP